MPSEFEWKICRVCGSEYDLLPFTDTIKMDLECCVDYNVSVSSKFNRCWSTTICGFFFVLFCFRTTQIDPDDTFSRHICQGCLLDLRNAYAFRARFHRTNIRLHKIKKEWTGGAPTATVTSAETSVTTTQPPPPPFTAVFFEEPAYLQSDTAETSLQEVEVSTTLPGIEAEQQEIDLLKNLFTGSLQLIPVKRNQKSDGKHSGASKSRFNADTGDKQAAPKRRFHRCASTLPKASLCQPKSVVNQLKRKYRFSSLNEDLK